MELMVVTSIFGILAAVAVPQYSALSLQMRTGAASAQLLSDLNFARVMAQRTGVPHYVYVNPGTGVNYQVKREAAPPLVQPTTDPVVRSSQLGNRLVGVRFNTNGEGTDPYGNAVTGPTPTAPIVFTPRGLPSSAGSYFVSSSDGRNLQVVSLTGAGRARLWTRTGGGWR